MLNTQKIVFILPDVAYIAELLATKKEYTFATQSFTQLTGDFLQEDEFVASSIQKLFAKLEKKESYTLILPDSLFTNTIVTIESKSEENALAHVEQVLLPELEITKETHQIKTQVLNCFKGTCKVQISALEHEVCGILRAAAQHAQVQVEAIAPLSWVVKSIISLEPSISILQMGSRLYTAQQYIGVDQVGDYPMDDYEAIAESIKALRGAEPSIQTVYLVSNELTEEQIKEKLSTTIPIQQLTSSLDEDSKIPPHVKHVIESCTRTLAIADFPVPKFKLQKATPEDLQLLTVSAESITEESAVEPQNDSSDIPEPSVFAGGLPAAADIVPDFIEAEDEMDEVDTVMPVPAEKSEAKPDLEESIEDAIEAETLKEDQEENIDLHSDSSHDKTPAVSEIASVDPEEVDLSMFVSNLQDKEAPAKAQTTSQKHIIKNTSGISGMLRMVFITIAVFFVTVAVGTAIGFGLINFSSTSTPEPTPIAATPEPTPEATPTPTPEPEVELDPSTISVLVVNATTKAGYAGKIKTALAPAKFKVVDAKNAQGEYEAGSDIVLMKEDNEQLVKLLEETSELTLTVSASSAADLSTEDPGGKYDVVVVLGK